MKKRMIIMGTALTVVFGGIIAFNTIKALLIKRFFAHFQPPAVSVASDIAKAVDWKPTINAVGRFAAINGVDISAQTSGNVVQIDFESGQYVEKDAPLVTLDDSVDQALLKFSQAELTLKNLNYQRQNDLYKRGAASISSVDEAKANRDQAQAKLEQTQAQIKQKHISAPFAGKVGIRQVNIGQFIIPGNTSIVSLQSLDPLYLEFYLPEHLYKRIRLNQLITFSVDAYPHVHFAAKVSAINSKVDANTHNMLIQATLANCPSEAMKNPTQSSLVTIRKESLSEKPIMVCNTELNSKNKIHKYIFVPGMFAAIEMNQRPKPNTVIIPSTAISYSLYGNAVYIIEKNADGKKNEDGSDKLSVKRVFVKTGEQRGNYTVIKKGVEAGQLVVSAGEIKLQNGTQVVINNEVKLNKETNLATLGQ